MPAPAPLAGSYAAARARFLEAASTAGAHATAHVHPRTGPDGGEVAIDVAELGPVDSADVVLVMSGTHGVEGYCGSALQTHWLRVGSGQRPAPTRVVLVHAFNPVGFAWVRRVNEDNVDLNRNFVDWSQSPPANPGYDELADVLVPRQWTDESRDHALAVVGAFVERHGMAELVAAVSSGQYRHPTGLFYGGSGPVWSHRWLREWTAGSLAACRRLVVIDLHSGLGPWGHGEHIVHGHASDPMFARARERWGDVVRSMYDGASVSAILSGDWLGRIEDFVPHAEVTATALEFGTVDQFTVLEALRADAWLHAHGDPAGTTAAGIRAQVRAAFADDDPAWLATLWDQFDVAMNAALA
jgi:hypothetical protein